MKYKYLEKYLDKHRKLNEYFAKKLVKDIFFKNNRKEVLKQFLYDIINHDLDKYKNDIAPVYNKIFELKLQGRYDEIYNYIDKDDITRVTIIHIRRAKHHPEFWDNNFNKYINFNWEDRDAIPLKPVNAKNMPMLYILEMVCDWLSVSKDLKSDPFKWYYKNKDNRWIFSEQQNEFINRLLNDYKKYI